MKKRPCVWCPHELTAGQHWKCLTMSRRVLGMFHHSPTLPARLITMDESWFHLYEPTTKRQGSTWLEVGELRIFKTRQERVTKKVMLSVFWDSQGVIHCEFLPQGRGGINAQYFLGLLRRFRESVRRRCCQLWRNRRNQFWLQMDGAPAHKARLVQTFIQQTNIKLLPHPPYSPDIAPSDFFLFARLKRHICGWRFPNINALMERIDQEVG